MFKFNNGYVGASRSVRSQYAIENFEVPLSMINKSLIEAFLEDQEDFTNEEMIYLRNVSVVKWKYVASELITASSWHHTSSYFNETDHYSLYSISEKLLEIKDT